MPAHGNIYNLALWGFNPLEIGAMPAHKAMHYLVRSAFQSPRDRGNASTQKNLRHALRSVSIPSRSGQCQHNSKTATATPASFNPLEIGAMPAPRNHLYTKFGKVSIPSRSGQCQHSTNAPRPSIVLFQSPRDRGNASTPLHVHLAKMAVSIPSRSGQCQHPGTYV